MVTSALREHRVRQLEERMAAGAAWQDWDLVFATTIGTPMDHRNLGLASRSCCSGQGYRGSGSTT